VAELLLHPQSARLLQAFVLGKSHALLLSGPVGLGKKTVALDIAKQLGRNVHFYDTQTQSIGIDDVRSILQHGKFKRPSGEAVVFVIASADVLGGESQNALLKILEEPPAATYFILTSSAPKLLLPTILSRLQQIALLPPDHSQLESYLLEHYPSSKETVDHALRISGGLPGLAVTIMQNKEHPFLDSIAQAKQFLASSQFERLVAVEKLAKDRAAALLFCQALVHVCRAATMHAGSSGNSVGVKRWTTYAATALQVAESMSQNGNIKVTLDYASLHL
jgi:DNA polymerase III delta prime subunit